MDAPIKPHSKPHVPRVLSTFGVLIFPTVLVATAALAQAAGGNGKIAFTSDRDGNLEIYVMDADGTNQVRLTSNPGVDDQPTWSPDGTKIAYLSEVPAGGFVLGVMNADGSNRTTVTPIVFDGSPWPWHEKWSMSWSPDGRRIAFPENGDIFIVDIGGTSRINVTNSPNDFDREPSWSPDGSKIVFASSHQPYLTLHTISPDGSNLQTLPSDGDYWDESPDWSPAGDKIAFVVNSDVGLPIIYTANADGTNRQVFDGCEGEICSTHRNRPRWSPDATGIVFHMWDFFTDDCQIYVKNVGGGGRVQRTYAPGRNFNPSWQPLSISTASVLVTANGTHGSVTLGPGQSLTITVSFSAGPAQVIRPAEVYMGVADWSGKVSWLDLNARAFVSTPVPVYVGPLGSFGPSTAVHYPDVSALPAGRYWWFVVVDNDANGAPNGSLIDFTGTIIQ